MTGTATTTQTNLLHESPVDDAEWYWMACLPLDPLFVAAVPMSVYAADLARMLGLPILFAPDHLIHLTSYMRWRSQEDAIESMAANQRLYGKSYGLVKLTPAQQRYAIAYGREHNYGLVSNSNGTTGDLILLGSGDRFIDRG